MHQLAVSSLTPGFQGHLPGCIFSGQTKLTLLSEEGGEII
jgi:hypothetical protein